MPPGYLRALLFTDPAIVVLTVVMGSISLATSLFDRNGRRQHRIARFWSRMLLRVCGVKMRVEGVEKITPDCCFVLAANHCSLMDTPVVLGYMPVQFRFFAKKVLFRIPFLGTHLRRSGHLPVVREDPRASIKSLSEGARIIRENKVSVLLFPEGSRSENGKLKDFKEGAAYIAIKAGVPVIPIAIVGTAEVLPIKSMHIRPGRVSLLVGDPIPTAGLKLQSRGPLTQQIREAIGKMLAEATCPKLSKTL